MEGFIFAARMGGVEYIKFRGTVRYSHCGGLETHIEQLFKNNSFDEIVIDLEEADILDSTALGLLARVAIELKRHTEKKPSIFVRQGELLNILERVCFDRVFNILLDTCLRDTCLRDTCLRDTSRVEQGELKPLVSFPESEQKILQRVVEAHRHLAELSKENEYLYKDITSALG